MKYQFFRVKWVTMLGFFIFKFTRANAIEINFSDQNLSIYCYHC